MRKTRLISITVWFLIFVLSVFLLLIIPNSYSQSIWVTLAFDIIAFVSQLIFCLAIFNKVDSPKGIFNRYPTLLVSIAYIGVQFLICIVTAFTATLMSFKASLIINFIVMILAWVVILLLVLSKNHVERIDSRQKDHHVEL